jgi:hydroxypyruvate isomerase
MEFSANLGFLWSELSLPDAIRAAKAAGFAAVECHWPYDTPAAAVAAALDETDLPMLGLNTVRGDIEKGENGLSALPERQDDARAAIDQAIEYARAIGARNIHVMAGYAQGQQAHEIFVDNLRYACTGAAPHGITILVEPLNGFDAPGYFLKTTGQACQVISEVGAKNLKLMFDCYHVQVTEGDLSRKLENLMPVIGHIQFASVPDRGPPDGGEINYAHIFQLIRDLGYPHPVGAEYKPSRPTEETLDWMF